MSSLHRGIAAGLCGLLLSTAWAEAQTTLRIKYVPGETVRTTVTQEMTTNATVQGQMLRTTMSQTMHLEVIVDEVAKDGVATVRQKIARITTKMQMPPPLNTTYTYDSDAEKNENAPPGYEAVMGAMIGGEFKMKIDPTGKMSDITVPPGLIDQLKAIPGAAMMGNLATEEGLRQLTSQSAFSLPEGPVKKGDQWQSPPVSMDMPFGKMNVQQFFTYEGPNSEGLEQIGVRYDMTLEAKPNQPISIKLKDAESHGVMLFDNKAGKLKSSEVTQTMTMEMAVGGQSIEQQVEQIIKMALQP